MIFGRIERDAINRRGARVPGRRRMEFPRQASICQEGLRTPSQRQQEAESSPRHPSTTAQCRHNAFNALFIPPAEESEAIRTRGINSSSPARPIGPKPTKFTYLREPLFFPTSPIQRRITVLRLIVPSPTHPFAHCRLPSTPPSPTR